MTNPSEDPFFPKWLIYTLIATSMIAIIGLTIYSYQFWGLWPKSVGDYAAFGDYVGGLLGSILSAATIFLLIWSLIMQREELKDTRKVLNETKDENARASSAHEMHLKHLKQHIEREDLKEIIGESKKKIQEQLDTTIPYLSLKNPTLESNHPNNPNNWSLSLLIGELLSPHCSSPVMIYLSPNSITVLDMYIQVLMRVNALLDLLQKYKEVEGSSNYVIHIVDTLYVRATIYVGKNYFSSGYFLNRVTDELGSQTLVELPTKDTEKLDDITKLATELEDKVKTVTQANL